MTNTTHCCQAFAKAFAEGDIDTADDAEGTYRVLAEAGWVCALEGVRFCPFCGASLTNKPSAAIPDTAKVLFAALQRPETAAALARTIAAAAPAAVLGAFREALDQGSEEALPYKFDVNGKTVGSQLPEPWLNLCRPRAEGNATRFIIDLDDVRASEPIRVSYDFSRDGWVIERATYVSQPAVDRGGWPLTETDRVWVKTAFISSSGEEPAIAEGAIDPA